MPLYDCMLLFKPHLKQVEMLDLVAKVGKHVFRRNGVLTDAKSFNKIELGYGIKKLDGRYFQGQLMQLSMMTPPNFNKELHYLNKEDRLLRWLLIKQRDVRYGVEFMNEYDGRSELSKFRSNMYDNDDVDEVDDDDDDDDDEEYDEVDQDKEESKIE